MKRDAHACDQDRVDAPESSPAAIHACIASLAAEAFEMGHQRAARLLSITAALLAGGGMWDRPQGCGEGVGVTAPLPLSDRQM